MTTLQLQTEAYKSISPLASIPTLVIQALCERLNSSLRVRLYIQDEIRKFTLNLPIDDATRDSLVEAITGIHFIKQSYRKPAKETADFICSSFQSSQERLDDKSLESLRENLKELLSVDKLSTAFKAISLVDDHANIFVSTRIITDVRPVFSDDSESDAGPRAALITHSIKLTYRSDDQIKRVFLVADRDDLEELKAAIEEALKLSAKLSPTVANSLGQLVNADRGE